MSKNEEIAGKIALKRVPKPPESMNEAAARYWDKKCRDLMADGNLFANHLENLALYCNYLADMDLARVNIDNSLSADMKLKWQKVLIEAHKQQLQLAKEFGFTPASAEKLPVKKKEEKPKITDDLD